MEDHPIDRQPPGSDRAGWLPADSVHVLRGIVSRYLAGERQLSSAVERLAAELARSARRSGETPERLLIAIRGLWRDLGLSQGDRLQAATLYEQIVRYAIESYYRDADDADANG
jgi:hypothetical protein